MTGHSCVWVCGTGGQDRQQHQEWEQSPLRLFTGFLFCSHCARLVYNAFISEPRKILLGSRLWKNHGENNNNKKKICTENSCEAELQLRDLRR